MENILKIIEENPRFFKQEVIIEAYVKTELNSRLGWVSANTTIRSNLDSFEVSNQLKLLRMVNILGLINESKDALYSKCFQAGIKRPELKSNKTYKLKISLDAENLNVIEKSGFGILFYNIGEMQQVFSSLFIELKNFFINKSSLNDEESKLIGKVFDSIQYGTTTNQLLILYSDLISSYESTNNVQKVKNIRKQVVKK
jgi:hypothetical protein